MQIPETPLSVEGLDLMKRLKAYADGLDVWEPGREVGEKAKRACQVLHTNISQLISTTISYLLGRVSAREMDTFTMHDDRHGRKVAHLMWHIMEPDRRVCLTPAEIGMLVIGAYLHDLGMALSKEERDDRLQPDSDLWDRLQVQEPTKERIELLRKQVGDVNLSEGARRSATNELNQAEEALLSQDTRERHATRVRYDEVLAMLRQFHEKDPANIPSIESLLAFDGDSFRNKLVDICISHNEDADVLVARDVESPERPRFPRDFPTGCCTSNLQVVAAALRLADILDFDRERTPAALFYYLIPGPLSPDESRPVLEWGKHMAISNWHIGEDNIVFRGTCRNHIIHHAIVQFCGEIHKEIAATHATFGGMRGDAAWPFRLPMYVKANIHEEGYTYVPYRFELDDQRIYELLMGGAIYDDPLVAVRELVQNAVDACKLRDALRRADEPYVQMGTEKRIHVRYEEPIEGRPQPRLSVTDTGTGMDALILQNFFLKVGQSYYRSAEFNNERVVLRKMGQDFAPVSEFGIGFLSCFLLADRVEVETAMAEPSREDARKRTLIIDGPTRLIRQIEDQNEGGRRFKGTRVTLNLLRGGKRGRNAAPPSCEDVESYLRRVCEDLLYRVHFEHTGVGGTTETWIDPKPLKVELPPHIEAYSIRIAVANDAYGLEGEVAIVNPYRAEIAEAEAFKKSPLASDELHQLAQFDNQSLYRSHQWKPSSALLRGGFNIGRVPGVPGSFLPGSEGGARLRLTWQSARGRRYPTPNLARNAPSDGSLIARHVTSICVTYLLEHVDELPEGQLYYLRCGDLHDCLELERFDALTLYRLAAQGWHFWMRQKGRTQAQITAWEDSSGSELKLGIFRDDLHRRLLDLILPRVTTLTMGLEANFYVKPPRQGWRDVLRNCKDFLTNLQTWGPFVEYSHGIDELLSYEYPGSTQLNSRFRERLTEFREDELGDLKSALDRLAEAAGHKRRVALTPSERSLVVRAQRAVGDLKIGELNGSWRLDSFNISGEIGG